MAHVREQIRDAVVTAVTGLTTTGSNVYKSRVYPLRESNLPGLNIYTLPESSEPITMDRPRTIQRVLNVEIEIHVKGVADVDETIDDICAEIEEVLGTSNLSGLVKDLVLSDTDIDLTGEGDQNHAFARMTWQAGYHTTENDAENAL